MEVTAANSSATAESTSARASGTARARALAAWLAARSVATAWPAPNVLRSTVLYRSREGTADGRGRTTTISESTNDEVPRNAAPSYGNRPLLAFLKRLASGLATAWPASRIVPSRNATIQCGVAATDRTLVRVCASTPPRTADGRSQRSTVFLGGRWQVQERRSFTL